MKNTFLLIGAFLTIGAYAQVKEIQRLQPDEFRERSEAFSPAFALEVAKKKVIKGDPLINGFIKFSADFDPAVLAGLGIEVGSRSGNIVTARMPVSAIEELSETKGILYVEAARAATPRLDSALYYTNVDWVHEGHQLNQAYTGNGVVVGVLDGGFDYTHPTFYSADGSELRISRVWEQDATGTPPAGFSYGLELSDAAAIVDWAYDLEDESHGSHVAGIAAGSGGELTEYRGVAYESELVLVSTGSQDNALADAISYIFAYAASVNKPAVINLSLGTHTGPHDGSSLFDQFCDGIVGEGKILVGAAGNEGNYNMHLGHTFTTADTVSSFIEFFAEANAGWSHVDLWGSAGSDIGVAINVRNTVTKNYEDYTRYVTTLDGDIIVEDTLYDFDDNDVDTVLVRISLETSNALNQKPHIYIEFDNTSQDIDLDEGFEDYIELEILGENSEVHAWVSNNGEAYFTNFDDSDFLTGDSDYTVGEIGGTGNSMITVGAYTTGTVDTNISGSTVTNDGSVLGEIATFSSLGPTVDNRMKPEITAPGDWVVSSISSYDNAWDESMKMAQVSFGGSTFTYGATSGTSMATPMVTGIIALMLEADPTLTFQEILNIFSRTAITDEQTGNALDNTWGYGRVDAHAAILDIDPLAANQAPTIANQSFSIDENASAGSVVGMVQANDPDGDALTFSITAGNTSSAFGIGSSTGQLTVSNSAALDYETTPSFALIVAVSDGASSSSATITVTLNDLNEGGNLAPSISDQTLTLEENSSAGTLVGTIQASDPENDPLEFEIFEGNESAFFRLDINSGQLFTTAAFSPDYESTNSYVLDVGVSDADSTAFAFITVTIVDVNESPEIANQSFSIDENAANGTAVGQLTASDPESNSLSYSITGGNTNTSFAVDASSGQLTVANSTGLDFETTPTFNLTVQVSDGALAANATVTISLNDVNENTAPVISASTFTIDENSANGTVVGPLNASDPENDALSYQILEGNTDGAFNVDGSGQLVVANELAVDFEATPIFNLKVEVSDSQLTSDAMITVNINDLDDITALSNERTIRVYPNPAGEEVSISFPSSFTGQVRLLNVTGKEMVIVDVSHQKELKLDLAFDTGIYSLHLIGSEGSSEVIKLLIN